MRRVAQQLGLGRDAKKCAPRPRYAPKWVTYGVPTSNEHVSRHAEEKRSERASESPERPSGQVANWVPRADVANWACNTLFSYGHERRKERALPHMQLITPLMQITIFAQPVAPWTGGVCIPPPLHFQPVRSHPILSHGLNLFMAVHMKPPPVMLHGIRLWSKPLKIR